MIQNNKLIYKAVRKGNISDSIKKGELDDVNKLKHEILNDNIKIQDVKFKNTYDGKILSPEISPNSKLLNKSK